MNSHTLFACLSLHDSVSTQIEPETAFFGAEQMIVLTVIGRLLIVLALALLGLGVYLWLSGEQITQAAGQLWFALDVGSLNFAQVIVQRHLSMPWLWDDFIVPHLLVLPAWEAILWVFIALMVLGGILSLPGRSKKHRTFR